MYNSDKDSDDPDAMEMFAQIAKRHLGIATLEERKRDSLDFHEVSVLSSPPRYARRTTLALPRAFGTAPTETANRRRQAHARRLARLIVAHVEASYPEGARRRSSRIAAARNMTVASASRPGSRTACRTPVTTAIAGRVSYS
jgi:hypothetical protein